MNFSLRNIIIGIIVLVLAVAIPVTLRLSQQQQTLKSQAATPCEQAYDGQTLSGQGQSVVDAFKASYTDKAEAEWIRQHNIQLSTNPPKATDNQTLFDQTCPVIYSFYASFGSVAPQKWVDEHNSATGAPTALSGSITLASSSISYGGTISGTVSANNVAWRVSLCNDATRANCSATSNNWTQLGTGSGNGNFSYGPANTTGTYTVALLDPNTNAIANQTTITINPAAGGGGGNVGVGVDASSCGPLLIDNKAFGEAGFTIEVNKPHTATIQMNNPGGNSWDSRYSLIYVGDGTDKVDVSPTNIPIPNSVLIAGGSHYTFTNITFTPKAIGNLNFFWQMQGPNSPQRFGAECETTLSITALTTGAPAPGVGICPVGTSAGFVGGADRKYDCQAEPTFGCVSSGNTPPYLGVPADKLTCPVVGQSCLACVTTAVSTTFTFGQCGICRNNPQKQADDPTCNNSSATKDDDSTKCTKKTTIGGKQFKDTCIEASCVSASQTRDCLVCFSSNCQPDSDLCTDPKKPVCEITQPNRGFCVAPAASPSPSVPPAPPAPVKNTLCYAFGEGDGGKTAVDALTTADAATFCKTLAAGGKVDNVLLFPYTSDPDTTTFKGYAFKDQTPGIKTLFVKFFGLENGATKVSATLQRSITFKPNAQITNVSCTTTSTGPGTQVTMTGKFLGPQGNATIKVANQDAVIKNWDETNNKIEAHIDQRLDGKNTVSVTFDNGTTVTPPQGCTINNTTVTYKVAYQCRAAGITISNADVKVYEGVPASVQNATAPNPILQQKANFDKDGIPTNLSAKLEKNKNYELITKAPGALAKRIDFNSGSGGTSTLNNGDPVILLQGDIAPLNAPDGVINAFDKSELIRQWSLTTDVARLGDFNGDSRINSIDYACMRQNIVDNKADEKFGFITAPFLPAGS